MSEGVGGTAGDPHLGVSAGLPPAEPASTGRDADPARLGAVR
ncbi:hypothetical protein [Saccharothrix syringae]|nr:hypothetical protein [Saccharothrix syringae]